MRCANMHLLRLAPTAHPRTAVVATRGPHCAWCVPKNYYHRRRPLRFFLESTREAAEKYPHEPQVTTTLPSYISVTKRKSFWEIVANTQVMLLTRRTALARYNERAEEEPKGVVSHEDAMQRHIAQDLRALQEDLESLDDGAVVDQLVKYLSNPLSSENALCIFKILENLDTLDGTLCETFLQTMTQNGDFAMTDYVLSYVTRNDVTLTAPSLLSCLAASAKWKNGKYGYTFFSMLKVVEDDQNLEANSLLLESLSRPEDSNYAYEVVQKLVRDSFVPSLDFLRDLMNSLLSQRDYLKAFRIEQVISTLLAETNATSEPVTRTSKEDVMKYVAVEHEPALICRTCLAAYTQGTSFSNYELTQIFERVVSLADPTFYSVVASVFSHDLTPIHSSTPSSSSPSPSPTSSKPNFPTTPLDDTPSDTNNAAVQNKKHTNQDTKEKNERLAKKAKERQSRDASLLNSTLHFLVSFGLTNEAKETAFIFIGLSKLEHRQLFTEHDVHKRILEPLQNSNMVDELFAVLRAIETQNGMLPTQDTLSYLISKNLGKQNMIKATFLFDKWQKRGLLPNRDTTIAFVDKLLKSGNEMKAKEIFDMIVKNPDYEVPSLYQKFINVYLKSGRSSKATEMLKMLRAAGFPPSAEEITMVAQELVKNGQVESAYNMLKSLPASLQMDNIAYTSTLMALVVADEGPKFSELFEQMISKNIHPDMIMNTALMQGFMRRSNYGTAQSFWKKLLQKPDQLDTTAYCTAMRMYLGMAEYDECGRIFQEILGRIEDGKSITALDIIAVTNNLLERKQGMDEGWEDAPIEKLSTLITLLNKRKIKVPAYTHSALASAIAYFKQGQEFDAVLSHLHTAEQVLEISYPKHLIELEDSARTRIESTFQEEVEPYLKADL